METRSRIFRWIGERIEPLPTPLDAPVIAFRDIDQDGRPDLLLEDLLSAYDGDVDSHRLLVSRTAAHSLPGGQFSTNDGAVHAFIRKECEGRTIESAEAADLMAAAGCARRSNVPIAEITLRYQKRCRTLVAISPTRGGRWAGRPGAHPSDEESVGDYSLTPMCSIGHLPGQATFEGKLGVPTDLRERLLAMTPLPPP